MLKVFLSYARSDGAERSAQLRSELERSKIEVWRDAEEMRSGNDWREQLRSALREVEAVLVFLTPGAVVSRHVDIEWENAKALGKYVIPVIGLPCEVPEGLKGLHYRNLSRLETYTTEFINLVYDLNVVWRDVEATLEGMLANDEFKEFDPMLNKLLRMLNARFSPPEVFRTFISLIHRMQRDHLAGRAHSEHAEQILAGTYVEETWNIHSVFTENQSIINAVLNDFLKALAPDNTTPVPIVLAVMNRTEAEELADFEPLQEFLDAANVGDWIERYHATPQEWQPFVGEVAAENIEQVVGRVLQRIAGLEQRLVPSFMDIRTLVAPENRRLLKQLRHRGCVVIVDSISIFHPVLQRAFQQAALDAYFGTSVVTISPTQRFDELVREMTLVFNFSIKDTEFTKRRFDDDEEFGVCEEILDLARFRQWLLDRVRKMAPSITQPGNNIRDFWWR
jgi:hypothetical protein